MTDPFPYLAPGGSRHANPGWLNGEYFNKYSPRPIGQYLVKVRRYYDEHEATSVLYGPMSLEDAVQKLEVLYALYQDMDAYYIEEWKEERLVWPTRF